MPDTTPATTPSAESKDVRVLFIDNFDSFTFNLVDDLTRRGARVQVWRNDIEVDDALRLALDMRGPRLVMMSPGPGRPADAGCCIPLVTALMAHRVPLVGICLGHQAIVEALGGTIGGAGEIVHGKASAITHDETGLFAGLASPFTVGRYHSLTATEVPDDLRVNARLDDIVMGVTHRELPVAGVQFHPESILTPDGGRIIENCLALARRWHAPDG